MFPFLSYELFYYLCSSKSYPDKQSDADHGNRDGCQLITPKRGDFSNYLDFKEVYSLCRFTINFVHYPQQYHHRIRY